jgi:TRAP-type mannitol/chloroaromatic compound transport system substrate-binding protein
MHLKALGSALAVAALVAIPATESFAQKRVKWNLQSTFGSQVPVLGTTGVAFAKNVGTISGGRFNVKFQEPGALVPALECFDAAAKGSVEACWTTPGYHTGKLGKAVSFFTAVPFGPRFGEFQAWKKYGNGDKLRDELYKANGVIAFDSFCISPETSGWFRKEIPNVEAMKGMKMRFFGLGALVMQKLGVSTQLLAGADIYPALEKGVIDATEFSMPITDIKYGFHQIAKFNYFPGWHQQVSCSEILMNRKLFEALPESYQLLIEVAAGDQVTRSIAETEATNPPALNKMQTENGVTVKRWPDSELAKFEAAWNEVVKEESAADPLFKKIADDYLKFRKEYKVWGDAQAMAGTYLK